MSAEIYPVGYKNEIAHINFQTSVIDGIPRSTYEQYTTQELSDPAMVWGYREKNKGTWKQLHSGDYLLFYPGNWEYRYAARISETEHNPDFGEAIFQTPDETFEYLVYIDSLSEIVLDSKELHIDYAGYKIGHPVRSQSFNDRAYKSITDNYGSVENYIEKHKIEDTVVSAGDISIEEKASDIRRPKRSTTTVSRVIRNSEIVSELKELYDHQCQLCGETRQRTLTNSYAEGHHVHPLGNEPPGPDIKQNILILCPNHHSDFDYGMIRIDPDTMTVEHAYENSVDGNQVKFCKNHSIDRQYIEYHNEKISAID